MKSDLFSMGGVSFAIQGGDSGYPGAGNVVVWWWMGSNVVPVSPEDIAAVPKRRP